MQYYFVRKCCKRLIGGVEGLCEEIVAGKAAAPSGKGQRGHTLFCLHVSLKFSSTRDLVLACLVSLMLNRRGCLRSGSHELVINGSPFLAHHYGAFDHSIVQYPTSIGLPTLSWAISGNLGVEPGEGLRRTSQV